MAEERRGVLQLVPAGSAGANGLDPAGAMEPELAWMVALRRARTGAR